MTEKQNNWMANIHELFGGDCEISLQIKVAEFISYMFGLKMKERCSGKVYELSILKLLLRREKKST